MPAAGVEVKHASPDRRRATSRTLAGGERAVAPGDGFAVTAGCDKQFATCRAKFANAGELPRLPAHARQRLRRVLSQARRCRTNDGESRSDDARAAGSSSRGAGAGSARPIATRHRLRGVGCDCLGLVRGVWRELYRRASRKTLPAYSPRLGEARRREASGRGGAPASALSRPARSLCAGRCAAVPLARASAGQALRHRDERSRPHDPCPGRRRRRARVPLTAWWRRRLAFAFRFPE